MKTRDRASTSVGVRYDPPSAKFSEAGIMDKLIHRQRCKIKTPSAWFDPHPQRFASRVKRRRKIRAYVMRFHRMARKGRRINRNVFMRGKFDTREDRYWLQLT